MSNRRPGNTNRIRGPQSALTDFLAVSTSVPQLYDTIKSSVVCCCSHAWRSSGIELKRMRTLQQEDLACAISEDQSDRAGSPSSNHLSDQFTPVEMVGLIIMPRQTTSQPSRFAMTTTGAVNKLSSKLGQMVRMRNQPQPRKMRKKPRMMCQHLRRLPRTPESARGRT